MSEQFGVIGLAVMGENLALNLADHGVEVVVFNRTPSGPAGSSKARPPAVRSGQLTRWPSWSPGWTGRGACS
jgi:3-hydroxyisobutyrate dehydrogenase-like beta-hydroxyacid dehydrogenase